MQPLKWTEEYSTHIHQFDNEHRLLFGLMNGLAETENMPEPLQKQVHEQILHEIQSAFASHTLSEEAFMEEIGYPADLLAEHRKRHEELNIRLQDFIHRYHTYSRVMSVDMLAFLHDWLVHHIVIYDRQLGEYCSAKK